MPINTVSYFQPELTTYIKYIGLLPDIVMSKLLGIIPDTDNTKLLFALVRRHYELRAIWLMHMLLNHPLPVEKLIVTKLAKDMFIGSSDFEIELSSYKPYAERSQAWLNLTRAIYNHPFVQPKNNCKMWMHYLFGSPEELWFCCEVRFCYDYITDWLGFVEAPQFMGKKKWAKESYDNLLSLESHHRILLPKPGTIVTDPIIALLVEAVYLANSDHSFRWGAYEDYLKARKKYTTAIRNCQHLKATYLDPTRDCIFQGDKHIKMPKSKGK